MRDPRISDHIYYRFRELERVLSLSDEEYEAHLAAHPLQTEGVELPKIDPSLQISFGKDVREKYFLLEKDLLFLQAGSYGSALLPAIQLRRAFEDALERNPCKWQNERTLPILAHATRIVAKFVGAKPKNLVFVSNATAGTNTVLKSLRLKGEGDIVVTLSLGYGAVTKTIERLSETIAGVKHRVAEVPIDLLQEEEGFSAEVLRIFEEAISSASQESQKISSSGRVIAVFDVVCSATAALLPYGDMVNICKKYGAISVVDGAHSAGQVPLELEKLGADFFVSNLHKWCLAPKGCAFLWVREELQDIVYPLVTSHPHGIGFWSEFAWTGTADHGVFFAAMACVAFFESVGSQVIMDYNAKLCSQAADRLVEMWSKPDDTRPLLRNHPANCRSMCLVELPRVKADSELNDTQLSSLAVQLHDKLRAIYNIECVIYPIGNRIFVRLSTQIYNTIEEYEALGRAVLQERGKVRRIEKDCGENCSFHCLNEALIRKKSHQ